MAQAPNGKLVAPYGAWPSGLPLERLVDGVVILSEVGAAGKTRWWLEGRPDEQGRNVLMRREASGAITRLTPAGFNARTRVHEYGGGAALVAGDLVVVSDFATGRLNRVVAPGRLEPITPERAWRFADLELDAARNRIIAVREDHTPEIVERHGEWVNDLVAIDLGSGEVTVLDAGADFYAAPRLSPDGGRLAWVRWSHPNMPWDGTELLLGAVGRDGSLAPARVVAGSTDDWVSQPRWSPEGALHFAAEPDGWMNLFRLDEGGVAHCILRMDAEFAKPDWQFGNHTYDFLPDGSVVAAARSEGRDRLWRISPSGAVAAIDTPYTELLVVLVIGDRLLVRGAGPTEPAQLAELDPGTGERAVLRRATPFEPDPATTSVAEHIEFPTTGGRIAHANLYRPTNGALGGPTAELPPLIVTSHGGPTGNAFTGFQTGVQLFTSRGYAVVDVDYSGSVGYGKAYRNRLRGTWGIADVDDVVAAGEWLGGRGIVDPRRQAVRGSSASGFTTLAALAFRKHFDAGMSAYGLGDLRSFVKDTHKFESRYMESMVGPWPAEQQRYVDRSPALHADGIDAPVLVQQGAEDRVVPPAEAELIVEALFERRIPHAYLLWPGEDHGFRGREAIVGSFGAELSFYAQVFGFEPADEIEPVEIRFLDEWRARHDVPDGRVAREGA
ncbi:MAG TPA: prolyl oligopeptidase family serine peptidase [Candidatus Limnocylindrales bacterium]|nr:prolyl oligopeptidase family serine peptidase [Candidatus Limnocylindrales bacterium]